MLKKIFIYVMGVSLGLSLFLSPHAIQAASVMSTLEYSNGSTYYGETQNGKPHGYGTMSWGKSKTYKGNWAAGRNCKLPKLH